MTRAPVPSRSTSGTAAEMTLPRFPSATVNFLGSGGVHPSGAVILTVLVLASADAASRGGATASLGRAAGGSERGGEGGNHRAI